MPLYELRTYTLYVGKMTEAVKLYQEIGFPALQKGGQDKKLVGYFQSDTGTINQLIHLWSLMTTLTGERIGQVCPRTRISPKASPRRQTSICYPKSHPFGFVTAPAQCRK